MGVLTPEAFVEKWQEFDAGEAAGAEPDLKILVSICNLLKMNIIGSKPLLGGQVREVDIPTLASKIPDPAARHL